MKDLFGHEPSESSDHIEIACELRCETEKGIAVVDGVRNLELADGSERWIWLPRSRVKEFRREAGNVVVLTISEKLAKEKGLL